MMDLRGIIVLIIVFAPPLLVVAGLTWLTIRILRNNLPHIGRGWLVAMGGLLPVLPFWCGSIWANAHPAILFRNNDGSVVHDEGWLIVVQWLFGVGVLGLIVAPATAIFLTRTGRPGQRY